MKHFLNYTILFFFLFTGNLLHAQRWHYYNPTIWLDVNTVEIPGPGIIAIGGGQESRDSIQVMFQTADYGLSWYENAHDGLAPWNKSIAFSDSLNGCGVGYDGRIIRSDDAGRNWGYPVYPINRDLNKIFYAGAGTYYAAGGNKSNNSVQTILKSSNYGNSWSVIYDTLGPWLKSLYFINTMKGFAVGDHGVILSTTNGGNTWATITAPVIRDFNAITFINADIGYIVGGTSAVQSQRTILRTVNGGANWSLIADQPGGILKDISFADMQVGYAVGDSSTVLQTSDGGLNWLPVIIDTTLSNNKVINAVKFYNRNLGVIGGKAGLLYIYQNAPVVVFTLGAGRIGTADATLLGGINTHTKNARYSFVYSNNIHFNSPDTTQGINVCNDTLLLVSEHIQGLTPNTTYYYFLKAITPTGMICGDTLSFYTGTIPSFIFETTEATMVGTMTANLNGFINKASVPVQLFFEYGSSPAFGSQVAATPATVSDTLMHYIQAGITNLQANTRYFFRLKGVSSSGTFYGDTKIFDAVSLPNVSTGMASNITLISAQLNGMVNNFGLPSAIKFEYGLTVHYGDEINATPDSVTGMSNVYAISSVTGLSPFTTYHYRVKAINPNGTSFGEDMTFITGGPAVFTAPASNINLHSAQINGSVNPNNITTTVRFEYGLTSLYGTEINAVPDSLNGSRIFNVSCMLSGLLPGQTYHFRVKATNVLGTVYGNEMMFATNTPPSVYTLPATEISLNSATLNGTVDAGGIPAAVKFEYGTTTAYGNEIDAFPDSLYDNGIVNVYASPTGLIPNTTYHFRTKGTNYTATHYGNDMMFYSGYSEIPNFDFENWTAVTYSKPAGWNMVVGKISRYSPACSNNYAVKIQNDTANNGQPGAILTASTNDQGRTFFGGTPFHARPDTLKGCFNYSIAGNDTAKVLLILKKQGLVISYNWFPIFGNSSGNYIGLNFPISYTSPGDADTLIIGFVCTNIHNIPYPLPAGSYLIVDQIRFSGTTENAPNNDFETWEFNAHYYLDDWWYGNKFMFNPMRPQDEPVSRTPDAQHGTYAALLQNFIFPGDTMSGGISLGPRWDAPYFKVNSRHQSLTAYYKFLPENNDSMSVNISMYKNHVQVGMGNFQSGETVTSYTPLIVNINYYNDTIIPDSCRISIQQCINRPKGFSKLYIDDLNFDGFLSEIKEPALTNTGNMDVKIYPNPFNGQATVSFSLNRDEHVMIRLYDLSGKQLAVLADGKYKAGDHKLNLSATGLPKGFYICIINSGDRITSKKLVIY